MKHKKNQKQSINFKKMTISKLIQKQVVGGVDPIYKPDDIDHSCSCGCGSLQTIIKY